YLPKGKYLFINVDANIIQDREFKSGTTRKYLDKYNLKPENVAFEITERTDVDNQEILRQVIEHYKNQGFAIAIDDVGSGYSGLNRINSLTPHYLKLDYELVHNVNESKSQKSLVELVVKYCRDMGYKAIAEGIETEEELKCLVGLGVDYGQGFLLSKPEESFAKVISDKSVLGIINSGYQKRRKKNSVGAISKMGIVLSPDDLIFKAYSMFVRDRELNYISIVDNKNKFIGYIKRDFYERNCWYNIEKSEKHINEYMDTKEALLVPDSMSQMDALKKAMKRKENVYDPVVVTKRGRFQGNIEIKTLVSGLLN
ncbi:MAG: EAL domain-containing protein, partial [Lachnospiraceae bacterium]|nr:EAL domain-containing protein [Lachnospiraceae bacterium]